MTTLRRLPDWPARFVAYLESKQALPFAWGVNDCATFCAGEVLAITGVDLLSDLRGSWSGALSARRRMEQLGGLEMAVRGVLGRPLDSPRLAQRGDVLLVHPLSDYPIFLAVCDSDRWAAPSGSGLIRGLMDEEVALAWGIGHA